jgi:protein SDA1
MLSSLFLLVLPFTTSYSLLKCLFPLLPRTTSPTLRTFIRKTILSDIRTANMRAKNHKLNRSVQAMLFSMVERGMEDDIMGEKGGPRISQGSTTDRAARNGEEAMWAVILTKELWRKGTWSAAFILHICPNLFFHVGPMRKRSPFWHSGSSTLWLKCRVHQFISS